MVIDFRLCKHTVHLNPCRHSVNPKNGRPSGMISKETYEIIQENAAVLDSAIIYDRDFHYN